MKNKLAEIASRISGVSAPIGGVQWVPSPSEVSVASEVIAYLEDRRVLFNPYGLEVPEHCITSIVEIRQTLTVAISKLNRNSSLRRELRYMREACRKCLNDINGNRMQLWMSIGELRTIFGLHIARICIKYELDVELSLASIIPWSPTKDDDDVEGNEWLEPLR